MLGLSRLWLVAVRIVLVDVGAKHAFIYMLSRYVDMVLVAIAYYAFLHGDSELFYTASRSGETTGFSS